MPMPAHAKVELGRGERILPGLWRLRLALPLDGVPHCNAWAIRDGDGVVLVDCGMYEPAGNGQPGSMVALETAMAQVGLRPEQVTKLVITHAHFDHWGQSKPVVERSGAEMWIHPNHAHAYESVLEPGRYIEHLLDIGRQSGVPEPAIAEFKASLNEHSLGIAGLVEPTHDLVSGVKVGSDLGDWEVYETPGHAPSHICLYQPERRILISGDHVLGRIAPYFDYGYTPDPIAEFLNSLELVDQLGARLALSGHGRPFADVHEHIRATIELVQQRLAIARTNAAAGGLTALGLAMAIYHSSFDRSVSWRLTEALCLLHHLQLAGALETEADGVRWRLA